MNNQGAFDDQTELAIWGCGLIGYTLAQAFARRGRRCVLTDIDPQRIALLNEHRFPLATVPESTISPMEKAERELVRGTTDWNSVVDPAHPIHIVCVPTERDGHPTSTALADVVTKIATSTTAARPLYLIIESTIAPSWIETVVDAMFHECYWVKGGDYHVGCSPRRDWFIHPHLTLANTPKIVGADSPEGLRLMEILYGAVCERIIVASDAAHAALVKVVENFFRYRNITLANQLAVALPGFNVAEVLRNASTKWNMDLYHPSFGIGGYCVPLAKDYLAESVSAEDLLGLSQADATEEQVAQIAREALLTQGELERVAILGLAYMERLKIHTRSPALSLARFLQAQGRYVSVHDPYYSAEEIKAIAGVPAFSFPDDLRNFDSVILLTGHQAYRDISDAELNSYLAEGTLVVDNLGAWRGRSFGASVKYIELGSADYYHIRSDQRPNIVTDSDERRFIKRCYEMGGKANFFRHVDRILAIDRDYLYVDYEGERLNVPELAARLVPLREKPAEALTDGEVDALCALAALGMSWVRLEHVDLSISMQHIKRFLHETTQEYLAALSTAGESSDSPGLSAHWWIQAEQLPGLRARVDRHYFRVVQIDGETWYRRELLLSKNSVKPHALPEFARQRMEDSFGVAPNPERESADAYFRRLTANVIERDGHPLRLMESLMQAAAEDPSIKADHTTLLCPRGTKLDSPWEMERTDFLAYVVFRPGFDGIPKQGVYPQNLIRKAMYAHHAAKKTKIARRYLAKYGPDSQASLEDNLGAMGIYFNEDKHHKGHAISGIVTAMRFLMPIEVSRGGKQFIVEGLTDFRVTRASQAEEDRFRVDEFPKFYPYGIWLRAILETTFSRGLVLPSMLD